MAENETKAPASEIPGDAICEGCNHFRSDHSLASNCDICNACERTDGVFEPRAWHTFVPRRLAGGALTPAQEREAYQQALRGEA